MKRTTFLFIILLLITTCKKKESSVPAANSNPSGQMSGKIVLPTGSSIDVSSCKVVARLGVSTVKNNAFAIDTSENNLSAIFLSDQNDQPIMMRYLYPGQQDNDLTAQSTALGLFMTLPSVQSLTDSAKLALLPKLSTTTEFTDLVDEVTKKLKSGGSFADGQDASLNLALSKLLDKGSTLRDILPDLTNPIDIYSAGNKVSIVNLGTSNIYGVGLYKEGQLVGDIQTIGGYDYLPTSLGDVYKHSYAFATHSVIDEPKSIDYSLTSDGEYTLKIRSGGKIGDNTAEATKAITYDLLKGAMNLIALYVPEIKADKPGETVQCKLAIIGKLLSYITNTYSISQLEASSPTAFAQFMLNSASYLFSTSGDLIKGCGKQTIESRFLAVVDKYLTYVNRIFALNSAINSSIIGYQLQNAKAVIDTCFKVSNGVIKSCNGISNLDNTTWIGYYTQTNDGNPPGTHFYVKLIMHVNNNGTLIGDWYNAIPMTNSNPTNYTGIIWTYFGSANSANTQITWTGSNVSIGSFTFPDGSWTISGNSLNGMSTYKSPAFTVSQVATYVLTKQ
jgi:hypothetical protein